MLLGFWEWEKRKDAFVGGESSRAWTHAERLREAPGDEMSHSIHTQQPGYKGSRYRADEPWLSDGH